MFKMYLKSKFQLFCNIQMLILQLQADLPPYSNLSVRTEHYLVCIIIMSAQYRDCSFWWKNSPSAIHHSVFFLKKILADVCSTT